MFGHPENEIKNYSEKEIKEAFLKLKIENETLHNNNVDMKCVAGCKVFTGGEIKHHKDCPFYPESLSKIYDDMKEELESLKRSCEWDETHNEYGDIIYQTSCGYRVDLDFAQPTIEHYLYCPFCGKKLKR